MVRGKEVGHQAIVSDAETTVYQHAKSGDDWTVIVSKEAKKIFVIGTKIECQTANCFPKSKLVNSESFHVGIFKNFYLGNSIEV